MSIFALIKQTRIRHMEKPPASCWHRCALCAPPLPRWVWECAEGNWERAGWRGLWSGEEHLGRDMRDSETATETAARFGSTAAHIAKAELCMKILELHLGYLSSPRGKDSHSEMFSTRCCCRWRSASDGGPAETTPRVHRILQQEEFGLIKFSSFISSCDLEFCPAGSGCGRDGKHQTPALLSALCFSLGLLSAS